MQIIADALNWHPDKRPPMRVLRSRLVALRPVAIPAATGGLALPAEAPVGDDVTAAARARKID